jgi:hypothetical protein
MQTDTRGIRVIIAEVFGKKKDDPKVIECADKIYEAMTGRKNPARGDALAGWLEMGQAKTDEMREVTAILQTFERELRRSDELSGKANWQDFARGFVRREAAEGRSYQTWLTWFRSDPKRMEWAWKETPETIRARWLMAFEKPVNKERIPAGV